METHYKLYIPTENDGVELYARDEDDARVKAREACKDLGMPYTPEVVKIIKSKVAEKVITL